MKNNHESLVAKGKLLSLLKHGDTVFTILRHVSRSGMQRRISVISIRNGEPYQLDYLISQLGHYKHHKTYDGLIVTGCGMDMGFSVVYDLGHALYPNGYKCSGEKCFSNDHVNDHTDKAKNKYHHKDGGYAFKQQWL